MTSSKLCSLRTCHKYSVSMDWSISNLKLIRKFFSATKASADAKKRKIKQLRTGDLHEKTLCGRDLDIYLKTIDKG